MKKRVFPFVLFFVFGPVLGQNHEVIELWPGQVPNETHAKSEAKISDNRSGNVTRLSEVSKPILEVFEPAAEKKNGAAVVVCPGGAYHILAIDLEGYEIAKWLNGLGYTAFVLQYRVPDNKLGALNDVQRAIRVIRSQAVARKLYPDKIGVMGFSAGGSLSARAGTLYNRQSYSPVDAVDELSCRPDFTALIYPAYLDQGKNRTLTPELKVDGYTPPVFLFQTADDPYGNSALVMAQALRDAKVPVELHILPSGGHGYGLRAGKEAAETWPGLMAAWLSKTVFADEQKIRVEVLAKNTQSWDGEQLPHYPDGTPEITVLKITIPPYTTLNLHKHPVINSGVLLKGRLTVYKEDGNTLHLKAGDALIELVETYHYGKNEGSVPAVIIVFYAGVKGVPITQYAKINELKK
ncbi:MAG: alpha/beta hydrolase fold domain-containing protein [Bacteroidales bacterium]|nr:alpha/beta hydrolase fold domain-containing protein [Bacteroidales bacterium]